MFLIVRNHFQHTGKVTNIPASMVKDQFGMVGLLTFIRAAETDPNLVSLALGQDLTALGLNLNSPENLYQNFGGPWAETPCRPQDIDFHVPPEYLINAAIRYPISRERTNIVIQVLAVLFNAPGYSVYLSSHDVGCEKYRMNNFFVLQLTHVAK